jgi:O-glycosyl hydrolase
MSPSRVPGCATLAWCLLTLAGCSGGGSSGGAIAPPGGDAGVPTDSGSTDAGPPPESGTLPDSGRSPDAGGGCSGSGGGDAGGTAVTIAVDATMKHQVIAGWGAEYAAEYSASPSDRAQIISDAYGYLKLTSTQAGSLLEAAVNDFTMTQNSNPDPNVITWTGFQGWQEKDTHDNWINLASTTKDANGNALTAKQLGLTGYVLGSSFPNIRWENKWLDPIRTSNPQLYLGYLAREALAYYEYYQNNYGETPPLFQFGNEEVSGNHALVTLAGVDNYPGGDMQEMVDAIKAAGQHLAANGFGAVRFLASSEEAVSSSLALATAILSDATARPYVGAISYHEYPYGSSYSDLAQILNASGKGNPPAADIQVRNQIRDLAKQYGIPVWLTEVSHGSVNGLSGSSFDTLRARAIDIHDNLIYADISAFWLQGDEWDTVAQQGHFGTNETVDQLMAEQGGDMAVIGDPTTGTWKIAMGGYAVGHYARWVKPGAVRLEASSSNPLVQITAFVDSAGTNASFVVINNDSAPQTLTFGLSGGIVFDGAATGEQSTANATMQTTGNVCPSDSHHLTVTVPPYSVTSIGAPVKSG